jgi:hypothetical protein
MTFKLQPKLNAYLKLQRPECYGALCYLYSSNAYATQKAFRQSIYDAHPQWSHMKIVISKDV